MEDLGRLEHLARINRLCRDLQNYLNLADKDLAGYLLAVCKRCDNTKDRLKDTLSREKVRLPDILIDRIIELGREEAYDDDEKGPSINANKKENAVEFRVLNMPDDPDRARSLLGNSRSNTTERSFTNHPERSNRRPPQNPAFPRDRETQQTRTIQAVPTSQRKRLSSPERFELKQLIASGAINPREHPDLLELLRQDQADRAADISAGPEAELDIELAEREPAFLRGSHKVVSEQEPIRVVRNPQGSMARAALQGAVSAAERKERKQASERREREESSDARVQAVSAGWNDPFGQPVLSESLKSSNDRAKPVTIDNHKRQTDDTERRPPSIREQRESLPIFRLRNELTRMIRENRILVVIGETGSGKTTQITQYLLEEGFASSRKIGCTQPRRVAAMSVAKRVAEEVGCELGSRVGYTIRFEDCTSRQTVIKYMTDGMLLRECLVDPNLSTYSCIILDEAHERTVHTDVLFGLCKAAVKSRPDLRLIVTSATLDAAKFADYFGRVPVFTIPGRSFPVQVIHSPEPVFDYLEAAVDTALRIHKEEPSGDILVFLTGQEEIETAADILQERSRRGTNTKDRQMDLLVLPVYSALPGEQQFRIFAPAPPNTRKIVLATNIAETSLTIDGIMYVVDSGFCKQKTWNPRLGMDCLAVTPISQAQARQRAGRAGRTGPGKCYRLFTEAAFTEELLPTAIPEIQRTNLSLTVLTLKAMGINDLIGFDFMDPPPLPALLSSMDGLYQLGALDEEGFLTRTGRRMAEFPLDPPLSKCLIAAADDQCAGAVLTIVAMSSTGGSPFYRPKDRSDKADEQRKRFASRDGDLMMLLNVYRAWIENGRSSHWAADNYIHSRSLKRAGEIRTQLSSILSRFGYDRLNDDADDSVRIRKALCAGLFRQAARRDACDTEGGYRTLLDDHPAAIHPSSCLHPRISPVRPPTFLLYHELVMTSREWLRDVTPVDARWLVEAAPALYKHPEEGRLSAKQRQERIVPLLRPGEREDDWRLSKQASYFRAARTAPR